MEAQLGRPDWWDDAACQGRHDLLDLFVPAASMGNHSRKRSVVPHVLAKLCERCPVQVQCMAAGRNDRFAIRAGTTAQQRETARKYARERVQDARG